MSESEQRRPLRLPQELTLMAADELVVLKAGLPPVRGRKVRYYREPVFRRRVQPPAPGVQAQAGGPVGLVATRDSQ